MREVSHEDLRLRIAIQLTTAPKHVRRYINETIGVDGATDRIMTNILNGCVVFAPTLLTRGDGQAPGTFGIDEPHPRDLLAEHLGEGNPVRPPGHGAAR